MTRYDEIISMEQIVLELYDQAWAAQQARYIRHRKREVWGGGGRLSVSQPYPLLPHLCRRQWWTLASGHCGHQRDRLRGLGDAIRISGNRSHSAFGICKYGRQGREKHDIHVAGRSINGDIIIYIYIYTHTYRHTLATRLWKRLGG